MHFMPQGWFHGCGSLLEAGYLIMAGCYHANIGLRFWPRHACTLSDTHFLGFLSVQFCLYLLPGPVSSIQSDSIPDR